MATLKTLKQQKIISFPAKVIQFVKNKSNERVYYKMQLQKTDGTLHQAYAWENEYQGLQPIQATEVRVQAIKRHSKGQIRFQILSLSEVFKQIPAIQSTFNWPICLETLNTQQNRHLKKLEQLIQAICLPHLNNFLQELFNDPQILPLFVELPASANHHHNSRGGLLAHSLECAEFVFRATQGSQLPKEERELGIVAALLHDIGKIKTMTSHRKHSTLGRHIPHEQLTLTILIPFLNKLEANWKQGAALLMQFLSSDKKTHYWPANPTQLLIKTADQFSTGMDIRQQAFKHKPEHFYYTRFDTSSCHQYVNRLRPSNYLG